MAEKEATVRLVPARLDDGGVRRAVGWATATHLRAAILLVLLALACFLPGLAGIAPVDRDEARFAQATRQMLETGDYIDIRLQNEPRYKKPVGIYWLQAATVTLTGHGAEAPIWAYRLASVLGAVAAVLLTYWAALPLFGRRAGFIAAAAMATSLILTVEAHLAKTDAVLLATVLLAQGALARAYLWDRAERLALGPALLFWIGLGLGFLIKGPVILMVVGLTVAALVAADRRAGWLLQLRPAIGAPLSILIVLPWFAAILSIAGTEFLSASVGHDLLGKVATGQETHGAPPGVHLLLFFVIFFPAVMLAPLALAPVWRRRREAAVKFCIAWIVPSWIVFELVATKLPHYTLPTYPAIAILIGGAAAAGTLVTGRWWTRLAAIPAAIFAVALPAAGVILLDRLEGIASLPAMALTVVVVAFAVAAVSATWRDQPLAAAASLAGAAVVAYGAVLSFVLPQLDTFRLSPRLAAAVARVAGCPDPALVSAGYGEPSLVFATGTDIRLADGPKAANFLARGGCRVALIEAQDEPAFLKRMRKTGVAVEKRETITGMSVGKVERLSIGIYRPAAGDGG